MIEPRAEVVAGPDNTRRIVPLRPTNPGDKLTTVADVLAALREPSEAMQEAAKNISDKYPYKPAPDGQRIGYLQISLLWNAMLDQFERDYGIAT